MSQENGIIMNDPRLIDMEPGGESTQYELHPRHRLQSLLTEILRSDMSPSVNLP